MRQIQCFILSLTSLHTTFLFSSEIWNGYNHYLASLTALMSELIVQKNVTVRRRPQGTTLHDYSLLGFLVEIAVAVLSTPSRGTFSFMRAIGSSINYIYAIVHNLRV